MQGALEDSDAADVLAVSTLGASGMVTEGGMALEPPGMLSAAGPLDGIRLKLSDLLQEAPAVAEGEPDDAGFEANVQTLRRGSRDTLGMRGGGGGRLAVALSA